LAWLRVVDGALPTRWDAVGALLALTGMATIALQPATDR
jgi:small multidrug resistance family-3 protein